MADILYNESWNVGNYEGSSSNAYTFRIEVVLNSQNIAGNTSNITINKYIKGINTWSWYGYEAADAYSSGVSNSVTFTPSAIIVNGKYQGEMYNIERCYHTYTTNITHNSNGSKTLSITNTFTPTGAYSSMPASNTKTISVALPSIVRASTIEITGSNPYHFSVPDGGGGLGYKVTSKADFYHTLTLSFGSNTSTMDTINRVNNTSVTSAVSNDYFAGLMSVGATQTGTFTLNTYSNSSKTTLVGTTTASFTVVYDRRPSDIWFIGNIGADGLYIIDSSTTDGIEWRARSYGNYYHTMKYGFPGRVTTTISSVNRINNTTIDGEISKNDILTALGNTKFGMLELELKSYSDSSKSNLIGTKYAYCSVSSVLGPNNFSFNGTNSLEYNLYVSGDKAFDGPEKQFERIHIPGRNGDLIIYDDSYKNAEVIYNDAIVFESYGSNSYKNLTASIRSWLLSSNGYCRLEDTYNPDEYRLAQFLGPINFETILLQAGKVTLTFDCRPERFLKAGDVPLTFGSDGGDVSNPTKFASRPLIKIVSSGGIHGSMSFHNSVINTEEDYAVLDIDTNSSELYIDCEGRNCYSYDQSAQIQNENNNVHIWSSDNDYPSFPGGSDTDIEFEFDSLDEVVITPRWWRL